MIHISYSSGSYLNIMSRVSFDFDYNEDLRQMENLRIESFSPTFTENDPLIPLRSIRQFCKPENLEAFMSFEIPDPKICVEDGKSYSLEITFSDGRSRKITCGDDLFEQIPFIKFFERYAKKWKR